MRKNLKLLRVLTVLALALCWPARVVPALDQANLADQTAPTSAGSQEFLQSLGPLAEQQGIARATFDAAFAGLEPDPAAPAASNRQGGVEKPLKSSLDESVLPPRT